jgi:hypothetical protein
MVILNEYQHFFLTQLYVTQPLIFIMIEYSEVQWLNECQHLLNTLFYTQRLFKKKIINS